LRDCKANPSGMDVTFSLVTPTSSLKEVSPLLHIGTTPAPGGAARCRDVGRYRAYPGQSNNDNGLKTSTRDTLMQISAINPRGRNAIASVHLLDSSIVRGREIRRILRVVREKKNPPIQKKRFGRLIIDDSKTQEVRRNKKISEIKEPSGSKNSKKRSQRSRAFKKCCEFKDLALTSTPSSNLRTHPHNHGLRDR